MKCFLKSITLYYRLKGCIFHKTKKKCKIKYYNAENFSVKLHTNAQIKHIIIKRT